MDFFFAPSLLKRDGVPVSWCLCNHWSSNFANWPNVARMGPGVYKTQSKHTKNPWITPIKPYHWGRTSTQQSTFHVPVITESANIIMHNILFLYMEYNYYSWFIISYSLAERWETRNLRCRCIHVVCCTVLWCWVFALRCTCCTAQTIVFLRLGNFQTMKLIFGSFTFRACLDASVSASE
jgi:hypothetical protein